MLDGVELGGGRGEGGVGVRRGVRAGFITGSWHSPHHAERTNISIRTMQAHPSAICVWLTI
jgi:hypothetical protein